MKISMLVPYSIGIVAANKPLTSKDIEVTPREDLTMQNGELTDNLNTANTKGKDADGASFETTVKSSATVTARWLPMGSNRKTAPDVRRGEKVLIWKFADADKYYWSSLEYDPKLRKLETIILAISNTQKEEDDADGDNTYFIEFSTHNKRIHLHTSVSDGEPFGYDFLFDTKNGTVTLHDTIENMVHLDSAAKRIILKNAEGTYLDLNALDLIMNVMGDMMVKVKGDWTNEVGGKFSMKTGGDWLVDSPKADFVTPQLTTSEKFTSGSDASINGLLKVAKDASVGGSLALGGGMSTGGSGGGDISLKGSISATGGATFSSAVKAPNIK
jgi:hypothetical protein